MAQTYASHGAWGKGCSYLWRPVRTTSAEVTASRGRFGINEIVVATPSGWRDVLRDTVPDPMIWFLAATALLFAWLGAYVEAAILAIALAPIVGMDAYLHRRTQASTEGLAGRLAAQARVLRDGVLADIASTEIVPGDVALVRESEPFPKRPPTTVRRGSKRPALPHSLQIVPEIQRHFRLQVTRPQE